MDISSQKRRNNRDQKEEKEKKFFPLRMQKRSRRRKASRREDLKFIVSLFGCPVISFDEAVITLVSDVLFTGAHSIMMY